MSTYHGRKRLYYDAEEDDSFLERPDLAASPHLEEYTDESSGESLYGVAMDHHGSQQSQNSHNSDQSQERLHMQMQYNHNRVALDKAINTASQVVQELRLENRARPSHYPVDMDPVPDARLNTRMSQLAMLSRKSPSSTTTDLQLDILKFDLRLGPGTSDVMGGLDKSALSTLIDEKLAQVLRHLSSLEDRIDDTSSKVLVTGDLNSGKSAFCNTLLRRDVLPEDQEPCTNVFCEIMDAGENDGIEEVHAVPLGSKYKLRDRRTYKTFKLRDMQRLVYESQKYSLLIVYVTDNRPQAQSLLKNGVIDIHLIDAPGLNFDSYQTTQLYARQEEIDLVVFVVSAENHFTLSGREFITSAANDKNLMFIVVNKFDQIRNKDRCRSRIMEQLQPLSPETYDNSDEFVHFVAAKPEPGLTGEELENMCNFDGLETSLRGFILEKRSMSKLLPAKTYLCKLYADLSALSALNKQLYSADKREMQTQLADITPKYESAVKNSSKVNDSVLKLIEEASSTCYQYARAHINETVSQMDQASLGVKFDRYSDISEFALKTQETIANRIVQGVSESEDYARQQTSNAVDEIRELGRSYLGDDALPATRFLPNAMYSRKKDSFQRQIDTHLSWLDFVDPNLESFCKVFGVTIPSNSTRAMIGAVFSQIWKTGVSGLVVMYGPQVLTALTGIRSMVAIIPSMLAQKIMPFAMVGLAVGIPAFYLYKDAPHAYQRNVVRKIRSEMEVDDYENANSMRIAKEVRQVLSYPANDVSIGLNSLIESQSSLRAQLLGNLKHDEAALRFYSDLSQRVKEQTLLVESYDLSVD